MRHVCSFFALTGLFLLLAALGCSKASADKSSQAADEKKSAAPAAEVTLLLNWYPEAEHGGFYAALVHGFYEEAGIHVKILPGGPKVPVVQQVARGDVTFGITNADNLVFARREQAPIVAIVAPLQMSPRCIMVHKSSGIRAFTELKDMTIGMSTDAFAEYLRYKVPLSGVTVVPYFGSVTPFLANPNYAQQAYVFSEPFVAEKEGGDPVSLMVSDLGFNPYTSILFTSEKVASGQPNLTRRMAQASARGWAKYLEAPEKTNERIHQDNPGMDMEILAYGAKTLVPLVSDAVAQEKGIGVMQRERWQSLVDQLIESNQLKPGEVDVDKMFDARFLKPGEDGK